MTSLLDRSDSQGLGGAPGLTSTIYVVVLRGWVSGWDENATTLFTCNFQRETIDFLLLEGGTLIYLPIFFIY